MSLIGIDLGTSAIKVGAYAVDGSLLASAHRVVPGYHPEPGHSEVDVFESREAFGSALREVASHPKLSADPPVAISFSSSGREVFPVASDGTPLGRCLSTSDVRGDEVAATTAARRSDEEWQRLAGHVPRRMDPVNRALWWRTTDPATVAKTRWFMNWHEYYALLLSGRPVIDWSDAGTWATYDVATGGWSADRIAETGIDPGWLADVQPNGTPIGPILRRAASDFELPPDTLIVTGAFDTYAASVGSAAVDPGVVSLACGTWNSFNMAVHPGWPVALVHDGIGVYPHPGPTGFGLLVTNPNGMAVIDWARNLLHLSLPELAAGLGVAGPGPGSVFADAALTPLPHVSATPGFGGTFSGVTLAATAVDIVRALLEGIACEFSLTLDRLRARGIESRLIRATGGGSKNAWWLQLMADLAGIPVEVVAQDEPGAFGAAILAGVGSGAYGSVSSAVAQLVTVSRRFEPDIERGARYAGIRERLAAGAIGGA
ncbi:MAG TPA: FGGY-family carbohydrate kinase [Candidatus Limnocylindrales bacterium]|nr:FGGY-family carbohydrate kinase [Candidatus Limnocylindrales bacterium]